MSQNIPLFQLAAIHELNKNLNMIIYFYFFKNHKNGGRNNIKCSLE